MLSKVSLYSVFLIGIAICVVHTKPKTSGVQECRNEQHRPQIHFSPKLHWINDPNGMVHYAGEYHLHYQYYPEGTVWGPMHWGHAVSTDLVTWTELDIALYPDELGLIFSGSAVVDTDNTTGFQPAGSAEKPIVAMFTHHGPPQQQSIAYSLDKGRTYTKYPGNPVIPNTQIPDFRDPKVVRINNAWIVILAVGDKIMFYSSPDLKSWTYLSEFGANPSQGSHGGVWECPDLFSFQVNGETHWVLLVSINPGGPNGGSVTQYFVGQWNGTHFLSSQVEPLWMDWGIDNYAGVTFANEPKNRINYMAWMNNWNYADKVPTGDYKGQMTFPRILSLVQVPSVGLRLKSEFAEELDLLRNAGQKYEVNEVIAIPPGIFLEVNTGFSNPLMEIDLAFNISGMVGTSSVAVCLLNSLDQELCFGYDNERPKDTEIFLNRELTGNLGAISGNFVGRTVSGRAAATGEITFKAVVDVSALELLVDNGLTAMTALFYPDEPLTSIEIRHHSSDNTSKLSLLRATAQGLRSMYDCPKKH